MTSDIPHIFKVQLQRAFNVLVYSFNIHTLLMCVSLSTYSAWEHCMADNIVMIVLKLCS